MVDPWGPNDAICRLAPQRTNGTVWTWPTAQERSERLDRGNWLPRSVTPINGRAVLIYGYGPGGSGMHFCDRNAGGAINFGTANGPNSSNRRATWTVEVTVMAG